MSHHSTAIPSYLVPLFSPCSKHLFSTHSLELLFQHVNPSIPLCLKPSNDSSVTRSQVKVLWGLLGPETLCVTPAIHPTFPYSSCDLLSCHSPLWSLCYNQPGLLADPAMSQGYSCPSYWNVLSQAISAACSLASFRSSFLSQAFPDHPSNIVYIIYWVYYPAPFTKK